MKRSLMMSKKSLETFLNKFEEYSNLMSFLFKLIRLKNRFIAIKFTILFEL